MTVSDHLPSSQKVNTSQFDSKYRNILLGLHLLLATQQISKTEDLKYRDDLLLIEKAKLLQFLALLYTHPLHQQFSLRVLLEWAKIIVWLKRLI